MCVVMACRSVLFVALLALGLVLVARGHEGHDHDHDHDHVIESVGTFDIWILDSILARSWTTGLCSVGR